MPNVTNRPFAAVILAAGKGKRMKNNDLPKVLVPMAGKPLLGHVLDMTFELQPDRIVPIVGHFKELVIDFVSNYGRDNIDFVTQEEQLGTGHAVDMAAPVLKDFTGDVLILCGDVPLLREETIRKFISKHIENKADLSVLTADAPDPTGYGRIIRDINGDFVKITEHKDASEEERKVTEFNSGIYFVNAGYLFESLKKVSNNNAQGEYYLTDIVDILRGEGKKVFAFNEASFEELQGINSPEQLKAVEEFYLDSK